MKNSQKIDNNYRNCPLCGSREKIVFNKTTIICNSCSLIYNSKNPPKPENHWVDFTFDPRVHSYDLQRIKFFKYFWRYVVKITKKNKGSILDVGCGPGIILKIASEDGWLAEGVEISKEIVDLAQKYSKCTVYLGNIENLDFSEKYDLVLLVDVFRHLEEPLKILKKCHHLLKNDGYIIIRELNANNFLNKKRIMLGNQYDLQFLSKQTAKKFLEKVGFKKIYYCPSPMSFLTISTVRKLPEFLQNIIMNNANNIIRFLYLITGKKIIVTPEVLFIGQK